MSQINRREILKQGGLLSLGLFGATIARAADACGLTPAQVEGPFYPVVDQSDKDTDLTKVAGHTGSAKGQLVRITGQVRDSQCNPLKDAMVEIWQACHTGKYNHPEDPNEAALDEDFQYWGRTKTDANGNYSFLTIKPGAYPASGDWVRPPHVHFKIAAPGFRSLTTQMYFEGEALNAADRILRSLPPAARKLVVSKFTATAANPKIIEGKFDVVLGRLGQQGITPELD
jgi:protocatechuate 3,4-dioxygenase beta subunit